MTSSQSCRDFVVEQLSGVRDLIPKAMFGGVGLYSGDVFFGILAREQLYLKVGDANRVAYERAGMAPFKPYADRPMTMHYWQVPASVLEDADELLRWARAAIAVAQTAPPARTRPVARRTAARRSGKAAVGKASGKQRRRG